MDDATQCLLDGLTEFEAVGALATWSGADFPCCGGTELGGKLLESGGFRLTAAVTLVIRLSLFDGGASPQEKQRIVYTSVPGATARALRIDTRTIFRNALLILECNDPAQGL
ncbi:MAG: hypothetical protein PHQ12_13800 [Chthoniobacteraceae bacterium]|nr:hypothetical protein [Chthoniobacteraceae bacterium]